MARKQETPASTAEVKYAASSAEGNGLQPDVGSLSISTETPALLTADEGGAPAIDPGLAHVESQEPVTGQEGSGPEVGESAIIPAPEPSAPVPGTDNSEAADQAVPAASDDGNDSGQSVGKVDPATNPNPVTVQVYPLRSYMDEGELRRRGGQAYSVPRRHAEELVQRKLASFEPLKE
ncbi:hypothetical protein ABE484_10760 [Pseudomonas pudica]|uniref:hypothetical protein n=1 Tax=Pseudomonas pudica TaxID=272772 RepID=UPI00320A6EBC